MLLYAKTCLLDSFYNVVHKENIEVDASFDCCQLEKIETLIERMVTRVRCIRLFLISRKMTVFWRLHPSLQETEVFIGTVVKRLYILRRLAPTASHKRGHCRLNFGNRTDPGALPVVKYRKRGEETSEPNRLQWLCV